MSRRKKDPLRALTEEEWATLDRLSRSQTAPAVQVTWAKQLLAVADGASYLAAAYAGYGNDSCKIAPLGQFRPS